MTINYILQALLVITMTIGVFFLFFTLGYNRGNRKREIEEIIKRTIVTYTINLLEAQKERLEGMKKEITHPQFALYEKSYNKAIKNQISYLDQEITKIKEL